MNAATSGKQWNVSVLTIFLPHFYALPILCLPHSNSTAPYCTQIKQYEKHFGANRFIVAIAERGT
jgi:hypothetical protein